MTSIKTKLINHILEPWLYMLNPFLRWRLQQQGAWGVVYMLHRVKSINPHGIEMNERMNVRPEYLEIVIKKYRQKGFNFLSLDQLYDVIKSGQKPNRPFVVFTLDDGYIDNYTNAWPIFQKYQVPFAVYVATDFPNHKAALWWYAIEEYLNSRPNVSIDGNNYTLSDIKQKNEAFRMIRQEVLSFPIASGKNKGFHLLKTVLPGSEIYLGQYAHSESMSWDNLAEMSEDPLCTICCHTVSHPAFCTLTEEQIQREVLDGVTMLQRHLNSDIHHFAYPYGTPHEVGEREMFYTESVSSFKTIMTCYSGFVDQGTNITRIPRMMLVDEYWNK